MDELIRQALQEGRLTVAGGGAAALYTPWAAGFEKNYPGITVQVRGAFSNQLVADIDRQLQSGAPAVDVAILQTPQDFARWKAAGALLQTDIAAVEHLAPDWRDDDGRHRPAVARPRHLHLPAPRRRHAVPVQRPGGTARLVVHRPVAGQQPAVRQWPPRRGPRPRRRNVLLVKCGSRRRTITD